VKITVAKLYQLEACDRQVDLFIALFGSELELPTEFNAQEKLATILQENSFDLYWVRTVLLTREQRFKLEDRTESAYEVYRCSYPIAAIPARETYIKVVWLIIIQILAGNDSEQAPY
jgi:hypothetical protein